MKLIVGLGNPGKKYEKTKHNMGFDTIDKLAEKLNVSFDKKKFNGELAFGSLNGVKYILLKPLTFMNLSGEALIKVVKFYDIDINDILVIYDDMDLPIGKLRVREKGSSGGQNGMKNIIAHLNTQDFARIRIGIGKPENKDIINYVLSPFNKDDVKIIDEVTTKASLAAYDFINNPISIVATKYN